VVDWLLTFGLMQPDTASYTNDRVWRVLSMFASGRKWSWPAATPLATDVYPFSAPPSKLLTREDFLNIIRDTYRGSDVPQLDLTRGPSAGPYGDPSRYDMVPAVGAGGGFPRAISMFRTSHSYVTEIGRRHGDVLGARVWTSQGAPHAAVYTPLHVLPAAVDASSVEALPPSLSRGSLHRSDALDGTPASSSFFWRSTLVNNWARAVGFDFAWETIQSVQKQAEAETAAQAEQAEQDATAADTSAEAAAILAAADRKMAAYSAQRHHDLILALMARLHDGYRMETQATTLGVQKLFYPRWWLERVGYYTAMLPIHIPTSTAQLSGNDEEAKSAPSRSAVPTTWGAAGMPTVVNMMRVPEEFHAASEQPTSNEPPRNMRLTFGAALLVGTGLALTIAAGVSLWRTRQRANEPWPASYTAPFAQEEGVYHSAP